jgi:hypothetical protein
MKRSTILLGAAALLFGLSQAVSPGFAHGHGGGGHHGGGGGFHGGGGGHHGGYHGGGHHGGHHGGGHHGGHHGGYYGGGYYGGGVAAGALIGYGVGAAAASSAVCPPPGMENSYSINYPGACPTY